MSQLVEDCPRCGAKKITFDVHSSIVIGRRYSWQIIWEAFCVCGHCKRSTVYGLELSDPQYQGVVEGPGGVVGLKGAINEYVNVLGFVSTKDRDSRPAPEHLPENVLAAFNEGAKCLAVGCYNAAGTMFRLCVDIATRDKLPDEDATGLNARTRRDLGLRLPWLFDNGVLPEALRELSTCIKEDGNDGAHQGTLTEDDALDLVDFTEALLERIYTEPKRLRLAKERREQRRSA